jgi:hypothetical protein
VTYLTLGLVEEHVCRRYPHCLAFLDLLLTSARFRNEIAMERFRDFVHQQQFFHWQYPEGGRQCEPSEKKEETIL